jgi:hypothetical protein
VIADLVEKTGLGRDRRQARDGYDVAVCIDGAGLAQLAHGGSLSWPEYVAGAGLWGKRAPSRACEGELSARACRT